MKPILDEEYWSSGFDITRQDLDQTAWQLERLGSPQGLKALAISVIRGRLEHGVTLSPEAADDRSVEPKIRCWDPAGDWQAGEGVLLVHDPFGNSNYRVYLGEITYVDQNAAEVKIDELQATRTLLRTLPGTENAQKHSSAAEEWRALVCQQAEIKLRSEGLEEQAEGILLKHGGLILARLVTSLGRDSRFIGLEGKWYLLQKLPRIDHESLQAVHQFLLQNQPASLNEILPVVKERPTADVFLFKMAIQTALQGAPDRFENIGTASRPQWRACLPSHDQAHVTHFAFDPQTFEILCRPGQRLTRKKARRLQELNLYAHVVTFTEWGLPVRPY